MRRIRDGNRQQKPQAKVFLVTILRQPKMKYTRLDHFLPNIIVNPTSRNGQLTVASIWMLQLWMSS